MQQHDGIDGGKAFDWGRVSEQYAEYRDIYPQTFYRKILDLDLCTRGQHVLDIGTGTGVLPRNLYAQGASFIGIDCAENQIAQARQLAVRAGMDLAFACCPAEEADFAPSTFDVVTACQCFVYFNHELLAPKLSEILKPGGRFAALYMAWLPEEDPVAGESEKLILKYNPDWTGAGEVRRPIAVPASYSPYFTVERQEVFDLYVPFTRESWHGRILASRGVGASLPPEELARFDKEHRALLAQVAPQWFNVLHYAAFTILRNNEE